MIVPSRASGAVFTETVDGDMANDPAARASLSDQLGVSQLWATLHQTHGSRVLRASRPGDQGEGDAVWTTVTGLPLAVFTADCLGVILRGDRSVGVAHAGWRGAASGVVGGLAATMAEAGHPARVALVGPGIGPCCFEVGGEVADLFPGNTATTTWGTVAVDLVTAVTAQLEGLTLEVVEGCTRHQERFFSHRRDGTECRLAALGWVP